MLVALALLAVIGCRPAATGAPGSDWTGAPDPAKAKEQAADFQTYGMPDSWANYGKSIQAFCQKHGFTCRRTDTDMSSNEEITKFDAEKNNPAAVMADIGLPYGPVAEKKGVVPPYLPPSASKLPEGYKSKTGGWIATFTGVPGFIVNTDVIKNPPQTWADLLNPEFVGKIGLSDPRTSGTGIAIFLAWVYANGGDENNLRPGLEFSKKLLPSFKGVASGNIQSLEKGEIPIQIKYDFNLIAAQSALREKGVNSAVFIPGVSIYAPSGLMVNRYNAAKMDLAKMYMEWVLSDEGQTIFAEFGARPIRYVIGDLQLPAEARHNWLPEDAYRDVRQIMDWSKIDPARIAELWDTDVLAGS